MLLYTCGAKKSGGGIPVVGHPCGMAAKALDDAGHSYELEVVGGYRALPWTRRGQRGKIRELTGQENVPVLVLDDGEAIHGSGTIVKWAKANRA